jgi:organic radical activating enzyme
MLSDDRIAPIHWHRRGPHARTAEPQRRLRAEALERIGALLAHDRPLAGRFEKAVAFQRGLRVSEYHLTNACNIRCKGCWFFEAGLDTTTREVTDLDAIEAFILRETTQRKINLALVIGGEPVLFPKRLELFVKHMRHVTISTNGLKKLPVEGFEDVAVGVSVWGGGPLDDELRAIKPGGRRFEGLFETALDNYRDDRRAFFVYAVTEGGIAHVEPTVRRLRDNGNVAVFNFYSDYSLAEPIADSPRRELIQELLRVRALYPETVISHPYYIRTMVTGRSHWDDFGYHTCPSISRDHPAHAARLANGNPTLPLFNAFAADQQNVTFCCTSGRCDGCRDSQAMGTWLLVNMHRFTDDLDHLRTWVELAESWWAQFCWSPYRDAAQPQTQTPTQSQSTAEAA